MVLANLQARAGIARANACRAGDHFPDIVVLINGVAVQSTAVVRDTLTVVLGKNDAPSEARFSLRSSAGVVPVVGHPVIIKHGGATLPIFGGQVIDVEHVFEHDRRSTPWVQVTCADWRALLNRRLVTKDYSGWSASDAAVDVVDTYTSGFFSNRIKRGMVALGELLCINEEPSSVLKRIAELVGGATRVDASKYVYLWDVNGEDSRFTLSAPQTLVPGLWSLKAFRHGYEGTQIRTRVIAEGSVGKTRVAAPVGATHVPIDNALAFEPSAGRARIGTQELRYSNAVAALGPPSAQLTAPATAGASVLTIASTASFLATYTDGSLIWAYDADGNLFAGSVTVADPTHFSVIATSGYGSLQFDLASGSVIYGVDVLDGLQQDVGGFGNNGLVTAVDAGESVVVRVMEEDTVAQAARAAIEGGDGIHTVVVSNPDLSYIGCRELALSHLESFSDPLVRVAWTTQDRNAVPGVNQAIAVPLTGGLTTTVIIDRVTITFPVYDGTNYSLPIRQCEGSIVKAQGWLDFLQVGAL